MLIFVKAITKPLYDLMKRIALTLLIPFCGYAVNAQTKGKTAVKKTTKPVAAVTKMNSTLDSASYAFGMSMATSLKGGGLKSLNYDLLVKGLKDAFADHTTSLTEQKAQSAIGNLFKELSQSKFASNIQAGKNFMEGNLKVIGVHATPSGLQYQVITPGNGPKPTATDNVQVHYKGTLLNGKEFDSSYKNGKPLDISLSNVITGWTEGVQLMSPGAKYKFFIPYQLAYGERGAGQDIQPYSTLIFEIELLKINSKQD